MGDRGRNKTPPTTEFWRIMKNIPKWKWLTELSPYTVWTQDMNKWQTGKGERREVEPTTPLSLGTISF